MCGTRTVDCQPLPVENYIPVTTISRGNRTHKMRVIAIGSGKKRRAIAEPAGHNASGTRSSRVVSGVSPPDNTVEYRRAMWAAGVIARYAADQITKPDGAITSRCTASQGARSYPHCRAEG